MSNLIKLTIALLLGISCALQAQNISISNVSQIEGNTGSSSFSFQISVAPTSAAAITLNLDTLTSGSATPGSDYTAATGRVVTIPANTASVSSAITVLGENTVESNETFVVQISGASAGTIVTSQALGTINNDDQAVLSLTTASATEGNAANNATLNFTLSNPVQAAVAALVSTNNDSAVAPQDFSALNNQALSFASNATTQTLTLNVVGENIVESNERVRIALSGLNVPPAFVGSVTLNPADLFFTINNDDSATLSMADVSRLEGNSGSSASNFALSLSAPVEGAVSVNYATADGTATVADSDYQAATGVLSFASLSTAPQTAAIAITGDLIVEADQNFRVNLSGLSIPAGIAANAVTLAPTFATGTIQNDDSTTLSIVPSAQLVEGNSGSAPMIFAVSLSAPSDAAVTANFATSNGTATAGNDYTATSGMVTIAARQSTGSISVPVLGDIVFEGNETLNLTLSAPVGATLGTAQSIGTIVNDDQVVQASTLNIAGLFAMSLLLIVLAAFFIRHR
jgi:hypothetical protein